MYVCACIQINMNTSYIYLCMFADLQESMYVCIHAYVCQLTYLPTHLYMHICMHAHLHISIDKCIMKHNYDDDEYIGESSKPF